MKTFCSTALAFVLITGGVFAQRGGDFEITKVQPSVVPTPDFQFQGTQKRTGKDGQWLEVEVEFTAQPDYTDELTLKYYILLDGGQPACLTGEVTHVNIPKGRELRSVVFVAPRTLEKLLGGKAIAGNNIKEVGVQILKQGQLVSTKSFKTAGEAPWWQTMPQTAGLVLNKNETPFAPLYWDRYEAIKSSAR